jgi:hypothetical protein
LGWTNQRAASHLSRRRREVNVPKELDAVTGVRKLAALPRVRLWARNYPDLNQRPSEASDENRALGFKDLPDNLMQVSAEIRDRQLPHKYSIGIVNENLTT